MERNIYRINNYEEGLHPVTDVLTFMESDISGLLRLAGSDNVFDRDTKIVNITMPIEDIEPDTMIPILRKYKDCLIITTAYISKVEFPELDFYMSDDWTFLVNKTTGEDIATMNYLWKHAVSNIEALKALIGAE